MQVTIRDLPADVHEILTERAKKQRQSLNAYLLDILEREAATPDVKEILAQAAAAPPVSFTTDDIVAMIRRMREA